MPFPWLGLAGALAPVVAGAFRGTREIGVDVPPDRWYMNPAVFAAGSSLVTNIANAREAAVNRRFQERMSSTSFRRAAQDMRAAGINPQVAGKIGGASTPSGAQARFEDSGAAGLNAALAVRRLRAETALIEAQSHKTNVEASRISALAPGELNLQAIEREIRTADRDRLLELLPLVRDQAKAELSRTLSSARAAKASAILDEASQEHAFNQEAFERQIGALGPWGRAFMSLLRGFKEIPK